MSKLLEYSPIFWAGLWTTVWIAASTIALSAVGALVLGPLRLSRNRAISIGSMLFVELVRGPSGLIWLFWVFYALPLVPGMPRFSPAAAAVVVLSAIGAAYSSEIVRSGIEAVHRGQTDACHALGLSRMQALVKVILPQALSQIIPGFASMSADLVKWTAIVSFVGVQDILFVANNVRGETYQTVTIYTLVAAVYWFLCLVTTSAFRMLERVLPLNRALAAAHVARTAPVANEAELPAGVAS